MCNEFKTSAKRTLKNFIILSFQIGCFRLLTPVVLLAIAGVLSHCLIDGMNGQT